MGISIPNPLNLLKGSAGELIEKIGDAIDKISTTDQEKLAAKQSLLQLERDFEAKVMDAEAEMVKAQAAVVTAETQSQSWMARNWRPLTMLMFAFIIFWNMVLVPVFGVNAAGMPPELWEIMKLGMGGYVIGRSLEKIVPATVDVLKATNDAKSS
jgi:holin (3TMs family)